MRLKVLFVTQEITPYMPETLISNVCRYLPQGIQERGSEIRTFMPRFGCINEKRNQLHEVIRLSGMNMVLDDTDHPLVIKVASIQPARMQVYFIDNDDFFSRKFSISEKGEEFPDNDFRALFFSKGVIEAVKKLGWAPDIIHCHGWFTALFPFYMNKVYKEDQLFNNNFKLIYSVYNDPFANPLHADLPKRLCEEGSYKDDVAILGSPDWQNLTKFAIENSDAVILGEENIDPEIKKFVENSNKPFLGYQNPDEYIDVYNNFYKTIFETK